MLFALFLLFVASGVVAGVAEARFFASVRRTDSTIRDEGALLLEVMEAPRRVIPVLGGATRARLRALFRRSAEPAVELRRRLALASLGASAICLVAIGSYR